MRLMWIGIAGFIGAIARYEVEGWISGWTGAQFPWGTLVVNLTGSFLIGLLFTLLTQRFLLHPDLRLAVTVGFIGAYTTFSTFTFETLQLAKAGALRLAALNLALSLTGGLMAVWLGTVTGRAL